MKAKIRKTGEIVDVIAYIQNVNRIPDTDFVSYIDSKGIKHHNKKGLNYYWDFESIEPIDNIDWEQRKYEIAKAAMQGILADYNSQAIAIMMNPNNCNEYPIDIAQYAIACADALIKELKKK